jgi:hypothetical protein
MAFQNKQNPHQPTQSDDKARPEPELPRKAITMRMHVGVFIKQAC